MRRFFSALCETTEGGPDLRKNRIYPALNDRRAAKDGYLRVVDDSGEDYLYPAAWFTIYMVPPAVLKRAQRQAMTTA